MNSNKTDNLKNIVNIELHLKDNLDMSSRMMDSVYKLGERGQEPIYKGLGCMRGG